MNTLRNNRNTVIFRELARLLQERIESGTYQAGDIIPTETALQEEFKVSRITVRNAVNLLVNEGLLRKQMGGKGTLVLKKDKNSSRIRKGMSFGIPVGSRFLYSDHSDMPDIMNGMINKLNIWEANLNIFPILPELNHFEYIKNIIGRNVIDGLFLGELTPYDTENVINYLKKRNFPFVFISTMREKSPTNEVYPVLYTEELTTINKLISKIKGKLDTITFLGIEGVEIDWTYKLFTTSPKSDAFLFEKNTFIQKANIFSKLLKLLNKGSIKNKLFVISSHNVLSHFKTVVSHLGLKVPEDVSVLYFKHFSSDYETIINTYDSIERDFIKLGEKAADVMEDIIERKSKGKDIYSIPSIVIKSVLKNRGSIR